MSLDVISIMMDTRFIFMHNPTTKDNKNCLQWFEKLNVPLKMQVFLFVWIRTVSFLVFLISVCLVWIIGKVLFEIGHELQFFVFLFVCLFVCLFVFSGVPLINKRHQSFHWFELLTSLFSSTYWNIQIECQ
jgi:hypothetical protein